MDPALKRAIRLGPADQKLVQLLQKPRNLQEILAKEPQARARLLGLARLYLLAGPRAQARLQLEAERREFSENPQQNQELPLLWPEGREPPRHGCVGTGTCCSASFLGPIFPQDVQRLQQLTFGRQRKFAHNQGLLEEIDFRAQPVVGMARTETGQCVAQGLDQLCEIHLAHGLMAKPVTCRQFPLRFHRSPAGLHVSLLLACDGYDRARENAQEWPTRDAEIRGMLAEQAATVRVNLPVTLSAGLPMAWTQWQALRAEFLQAEPHEAHAELWLDRVLELAEKRIGQKQQELAEMPEMQWKIRLNHWRRVLREPRKVPRESLQAVAAQLRLAASELTDPRRGRDRDRLRALAQGLEHLEQPQRPWTPMARQHLHDIVCNDLQVQVIVGELDVGLENLTLRVLLARAVAEVHAGEKPQVEASDTTFALHVVYRSERELAWLGGILPVDDELASANQPATTDP